jgi:hypothetical protein
MTGSVKLGIQDLSVPQGTHLCGFFWGRERGDLVFPYLREGLRSGEKCLCAFDGSTEPGTSQMSTRSTAARMGPGRAGTGIPRTKTLGVPATPRATARSVTNAGQGR